jgi:4-amino-4-deoxy-L-arabinose transferase-like glycosyltransferase
VPAPLAYLLGAVLLVTLTWAYVVPPWQAPDEDHHFAYVQTLGEGLGLPGDEDRPEQSTEQRLATSRSNAEQTAQVLTTELEWSEPAYRRWQRDDGALPPRARSDGGGVNPASTNPPLYYFVAWVPYQLARSGDVFDRLYLSRALSALFLLATVTFAWLLAGEVFGPRRPLQLAAAAVTGLEPMMTFISGSLNPDSMLYAVWALALWLGVRLLRRGLTAGRGIAFFAAIGVGTLVKATTLVMLPGALLVLAVGVVRRGRRGESRRAAVLSGVAALGALGSLAGGWLVATRLLGRPALFQIGTTEGAVPPESPLRLLASYLWQFYLPKLPFQQEFTGFPPLPVYDFWIKQGWGAFGSLEVELPEPVYLLLAAVTAATLVAGVVALVRAGRAGRVDWAVPAFFAVVALGLLGGLHWTEYRLLVAVGGPFSQGRYLLPLVPLAGLAAAAGLTLVPGRLRSGVLAAGLAGLLAVQALSLAVVIGRFYA